MSPRIELGRVSCITVRVVDASAHPPRRELKRGALVLGAGSESDVVIDHRSVSRRHASLEVLEDGVELVDLGSINGTYVDGRRVGRVHLASSCTVSLGDVRVSIEIAFKADDPSPFVDAESVAASPSMQRVVSLLKRAAPSNVPILLEGESGTGKEVMARLAHRLSAVATGPFVSLNCGYLDRSLARSELFGHRRGSFTGATDDRKGIFESAAGGTLFLDEIGELPLEIQPFLLRALETERCARIGETVERPITARLVVATNRVLSSEVTAGRFRSDLYFRLNVVRIEIPPLRDRTEDIVPLAHRFAREFGIGSLPERALESMSRHDWPGNVRELRNVLRGYAAIGCFPDWMERTTANPTGGYTEMIRKALDLERPYHDQKAELFDRFLDVYLDMLLEQTNGNQSEAARISGLDRSYLNRALARRRASRSIVR